MTQDPTPTEIAALCEQLQSSWTDREKLARQQWQPVNGTLVRPNQEHLPVYSVPELSLGVISGRAA